MESVLGSILVLFGLLLVLLAVLVWIGALKPKGQMGFAGTETGWPDVAKEVLNKVPWVALVGVALIYLGLRTIGVDLSF